MKILHLTQNFYPVVGGIETFVYESSKRLVEKGYKIYVITNDRLPITGEKLPRYEIIDNIKIFRVPFHMVFRYNFSLKVLKLVLNLDWDIVHIHGLGFLSDLSPFIKILKGRKIILSTHGGIFHTPYMSILKKIYFNAVCRFTFNFIDRVIAVSENDKKLFSKINKEIEIVPPGVDCKKYDVKKKSDGKTLVYIGRLSENKRIERILYSLVFVKKAIPDVKCFIGGENWKVRKRLEMLTKNLNLENNVTFLGKISEEEKIYYLSVADLFLLPSDYEGFGISVLEAMASGTPVVVNNIESMINLTKNGEVGFITNFKDSHKTAELIINLLKNKKLRNSIGRKAKKYSKLYNWNKIVDLIERIYKNCL